MIEHWFHELGYFCKEEIENLHDAIGSKYSISFSNFAGNCSLCIGIKSEKKVGKMKMFYSFVHELIYQFHSCTRTRKMLERYINAKCIEGKFVVYDDGGYTMSFMFDEANKISDVFSLSKRTTHEGYPIITICGKESKQEVYDWLQNEKIDFITLKE